MAITSVDLRDLRRGPAARRAFLRRLDAAARSTGFVLVTGHRIPAPVLAAARREAAAFFALPESEKRRSARPGVLRGWAAVGAESLAYTRGRSSPPDLNESFQVGRPASSNAWPRRPRGLKPSWTRLERELDRLSEELLGAFSLALELPEGWLAQRAGRRSPRLRARHYVPRPERVRPGQQRAGAHTDYVALTILSAERGPGGLQARSGGRWVDVQPRPGALIVNVGDLLERWSNGRWRSALHRVVLPPPGWRKGRLSLAYFCAPAEDALVSPAREGLPGRRPPRWKPVRAGAYVRAKLARARRY